MSMYQFSQRLRGKSLLRQALLERLRVLGYRITDRKYDDGLCYTTYTSPGDNHKVMDVKRTASLRLVSDPN